MDLNKLMEVREKNIKKHIKIIPLEETAKLFVDLWPYKIIHTNIF